MIMESNEHIKKLKQSYIAYYKDVPVQKYAAMSISRNEDTIIRWKHDDPSFADAVEKARADWVRNKMLSTKAEFALERLEKSVFSQHSSMEVQNTGIEVTPTMMSDNKALIDHTLSILMEATKRSSLPEVQTTNNRQ